jgi:hypothetical protein
MQKRILIAATAALLSLPLALNAADQAKKKGPFVVADTDGNGSVSRDEYIAVMAGKLDKAAATTKFAELDKNKDGSLDRQEFNAGAGAKKDGEKTDKTEKTDDKKGGGKKKKDAN